MNKEIKDGAVGAIIAAPLIFVIEVLCNYLKTKLTESSIPSGFSLTGAMLEAILISLLLGSFLAFIYTKVRRRIDIHDQIMGKKAGNEDVIWYALDYRTKKLNNGKAFNEVEEKEHIKKVLEKKFGDFMTAAEISDILASLRLIVCIKIKFKTNVCTSVCTK
jgi:hypothetical protein